MKLAKTLKIIVLNALVVGSMFVVTPHAQANAGGNVTSSHGSEAESVSPTTKPEYKYVTVR